METLLAIIAGGIIGIVIIFADISIYIYRIWKIMDNDAQHKIKNISK